MGLGNRMSDSYFKQNICFKNLTRVCCLTHVQAAAILTGADLMDPVSALSEAVTQGLYHEWVWLVSPASLRDAEIVPSKVLLNTSEIRAMTETRPVNICPVSVCCYLG